MPTRNMRPVHPGEILREDYLVPLRLSANALARRLGVPANRVSAILAGKRGITADTALRLAKIFRSSPELWMNLQQAYDLAVEKPRVARILVKIRPIAPAA